uniref:Uncharacterized protein n=1 Tax=Anguilla anguilla TaxID=7936 RepID=A0A0E9UTD4_ANGAN
MVLQNEDMMMDSSSGQTDRFCTSSFSTTASNPDRYCT